MSFTPAALTNDAFSALKVALFVAKFVPIPGVAAAASIAEEFEPVLEKALPIAEAAMPLIQQVFQLIGKHVEAGASIDEALGKVDNVLGFHLHASPQEEQAMFDRSQGSI